MTCLRIPTSLEDADTIVAACSGYVDWRPLFVLGLGWATMFVLVVVAIALAVRWAR